MNKKIVFIADFFVEHILGGGELNNEELIGILKNRGRSVQKIQSHAVDTTFIKNNKDSLYIISNFINLNNECRLLLAKNSRYIIYEHDHKYIKSRNPADFVDYKAPPDQIVNRELYSNAIAVLCQSKMHHSIVRKNLELDNIVNLGGNLWPLEILEFLEGLATKEKEDRCAIMASQNWHKNTNDAIKYCRAKSLDFVLIHSGDYKEFLTQLGQNKKLVFFPKTPETLSRIVVESRMMGMSAIINKNVGASSEDWFSLKGAHLIQVMKDKRHQITDRVIKLLDG